jgi:hypothetical protein
MVDIFVYDFLKKEMENEDETNEILKTLMSSKRMQKLT